MVVVAAILAAAVAQLPPDGWVFGDFGGVLSNLSCIPESSFVVIFFDEASTVRSNLGGQGGRCLTEHCDIPATADPPPEGEVPHEVYIRDVGRNIVDPEWLPPGGAANGEYIDMRITNRTEYYAWNTRWNGVKLGDGTRFSSFAVTNLAGPRSRNQSGFIWNTEMTYVELKYEFFGRTEPWRPRVPIAPLTISRTYVAELDLLGPRRSPRMPCPPCTRRDLPKSSRHAARPARSVCSRTIAH